MRRLRSSSIKSRGVVFLALLVCLFGSVAVGQPWDGNGTPNYPYLIYDACDMQAIGADSNYWDAHFKLMADIDLGGFTGTGFNMIGEGGNPFTGVFDGNGHTISNFTYNSSGTSFVGIFGLVYETGAEIKNLGLIDPNVDAGFGHYVGSLVGWIENGRVTNCRVEGGSVSGKRSGVGGLVGENWNGTISNCYSMVSVTGDTSVGGLTGYNYDDGTIIDCHSVAVVSGQEFVGGLVGYNYGQLYDCYSASDVSGNRRVGCLVGRSGNWGIISNCAASGSVVGEEDFGGLVGVNTGRSLITDCYSTSAVSGVGGGGMTVGGLVGLNHGVGWGDAPRISNSYSVGGISGALDEVGGLVGCNGAKGTVSNCYSSMRMEGCGDWAGGLVGVNEGTITDSYSTGSISGMEYIGGLVGWNSGEVVDSYSERTVSGDDSGVGGLAGYNYNSGIISGSFATGEVSGGSAVGGLVGENEWEISDCYATGKVSGDDSVGGLVGFNLNYDGIGISNCYSLSDVNGTRYHAGGFVGSNVLGVISNCYCAGDVNGTNGVGGFVGYQDNSCVYQRNFWDSDVNPDVNGIGNASDPNVIGKGTAEMQTESTFTDAGWDFVGEVINGPNDIWDICEGTNYPKFVWQIPAADFVCPDGVNFVDFSVLGAAWMSSPGQIHWDPNCDISEPNDSIIDERDMAVFCENWLAGV